MAPNPVCQWDLPPQPSKIFTTQKMAHILVSLYSVFFQPHSTSIIINNIHIIDLVYTCIITSSDSSLAASLSMTYCTPSDLINTGVVNCLIMCQNTRKMDHFEAKKSKQNLGRFLPSPLGRGTNPTPGRLRRFNNRALCAQPGTQRKILDPPVFMRVTVIIIIIIITGYNNPLTAGCAEDQRSFDGQRQRVGRVPAAG